MWQRKHSGHFVSPNLKPLSRLTQSQTISVRRCVFVTMTFKRHIAIAVENFSWPSPDYYPMLIMQPIFGNWDRALSSALYLRQLSVMPASLCQCSFYLLCSIAFTVFVVLSAQTIPLYASLWGSPMTSMKQYRRHSFKTLIAASVAITVALVLSYCIFALSSNRPVSTFCLS